MNFLAKKKSKHLSIIKLFTSLGMLLLVLFTTSCKKDKLDLSSSTFFGIKEILKSENCNADCGETADCEGKTVKVRGELDASNINASDDQFYLIDEGDDGFTLEVKVSTSVSDDVFQKLNGQGGKTVMVTGVMAGYDANTNTNCNRQFTLTVNDDAEVTVE